MVHNTEQKTTSSYRVGGIMDAFRNLLNNQWSFLGIPKRSWLRIILFSPLAGLLFLFILILSYTVINPGLSTIMARDLLSGRHVSHHWVPMERISRHMPVAVIMAEDNRFCEHYGVDWSAIRRVLASRRSKLRGASTITMQAVKNLFLWPDRNYVRKAIEISLAHTVTMFWSKRRVMEIYLNVVEFGPGIYGVEAAARYHFGKRASQLTWREAALLAAVLPNPSGRRAGRPGPKTRSIAGLISRRMRAGRRYSYCVR